MRYGIYIVQYNTIDSNVFILYTLLFMYLYHINITIIDLKYFF